MSADYEQQLIEHNALLRFQAWINNWDSQTPDYQQSEACLNDAKIVLASFHKLTTALCKINGISNDILSKVL